MKIRVAYDKDKKTGEGTGICVMEGKVAKAGLSGWLSGIRRGGHAVANISLVIISRPRWQDQEKMQLQDRLLRNFAQEKASGTSCHFPADAAVAGSFGGSIGGYNSFRETAG